MKFARNADISRGHLDAAPYVSVLMLLLIFLMAWSFIYTPGIRIQPPLANDLPGADRPSVSVALDKNGSLYFENKAFQEAELRTRLSEIARNSKAPLTLLVYADKDATQDMLVHLALLARDAGIPDAFLATLPRPVP